MSRPASHICRPRRTYHITGHVALGRIQPLLLEDESTEWVAFDPSDDSAADFLWENAPRSDTKSWRDQVQCYSHLPNGTSILDSKWVLGRLLGHQSSSDPKAFAALETHCFRGKSGYRSFLESVGLAIPPSLSHTTVALEPRFHDLMEDSSSSMSQAVTMTDDVPNMWVVKDAYCNGAGGIWVMGAANTSIIEKELTEEHMYVAQRYVYPPVLFRQRKCHVRVYALLTSDGGIFCHRRCFLHVANDRFTTHATGDVGYENSIHITNCCANSHDADKFAGEICADLTSALHVISSPDAKDHDITVGLEAFAPSIFASIAKLAQETLPFLQGGEGHAGFEYLGLDFILSHRGSADEPIAYLLEVNAPPSQDTATKLPHAEELHNTVLRDLLALWVYPKTLGVRENPGGWMLVHQVPHCSSNDGPSIVPSKAAILNKIRWNLWERKQQGVTSSSTLSNNTLMTARNKAPDMSFAHFARSFFPYFSASLDDDGTTAQITRAPLVFMENAGGTQVPRYVIEGVRRSLEHRNRSQQGKRSVQAAKEVLATLLGASSRYSIWLGANASMLLDALALWYVQSNRLQRGDEILLMTENHMAHVQPWLDAAALVGARILWCDSWSSLESLLSIRTRIVAVSHASNVLGQVNHMIGPRLRALVDTKTNGLAHIVVDGVAYVPHRYAGLDEMGGGVDWYVISCHKLFGPHLGVLCGRQSMLDQLDTDPPKFQHGTVNYESCEGVLGLGRYFTELAAFSTITSCAKIGDLECRRRCADAVLDKDQVVRAYQHIQSVERTLVDQLLTGLRRCKKVRVIRGAPLSNDYATTQLPIVCFVHETISSRRVVECCYQGGVACRNGTFLSTEQFQKEHHIGEEPPMEGVVRFSMAHFNTSCEVAMVLNVLESIPGWM